ncbi:MAG: AAA family ATPase [Candidatus Andersenbacteria bacterium]|nr:AAA family ATPase [Candidatus Andersenbacteria bacterium]
MSEKEPRFPLPPKEPEEPTPAQKNFNDIAKRRKTARQTLAELEKQGTTRPGGALEKVALGELAEASEEAADFSIAGEGGLTSAKERLRSERTQAEKAGFLDEAAIEAEMGPEYKNLSVLEADLADLTDFEMRRMRESHTDPHAKRDHEHILKATRQEKQELTGNREKLVEVHPKVARALELVTYKKGLHEEGHIAPTPSVKQNLSAIGSRMVSGKPMFLHGPTGTGKTSLARYAAGHFTGKAPEIVYCNPQTRESNIWGKTGIRPAKEGGGAIETVDIYGPQARAMTEGKVAIYDEFTALPREQMVFLKGEFNAKVGDTVNVVGNGQVKIEPGFQMIFTANLKSEKNPERQELPPEIAREFEQNNLKVEYTPPHEAYDIMLARLMNSDGSVDMSYHDMNETLPALCRAMADIQAAYTGELNSDTARLTGTQDASGHNPGLKKLVMTQGTVENILEAWQIERRSGEAAMSFTAFLDQRLKTALTFEEYPEKDRMLAAKVLAARGLLSTITAADLRLPADVFDVDAMKKLRGPAMVEDLKKASGSLQHIPLSQLTELDPFGQRQQKAAEAAAAFLGPIEITEEDIVELEPLETGFNNFLRETFQNNWSFNADQMRVAETNLSAELIKPADINWAGRKADIDATKAGQYTLNPDTVGVNLDMLDPAKIEIIDLSPMRGKPLDEVAKYIVDTYGTTHHIPGLEYWQHILQDPNKMPDQMKADQPQGNWGNAYFMFGSLLRRSNGDWVAPYARWGGDRWGRYAHGLARTWGDLYRAVLFKK